MLLLLLRQPLTRYVLRFVYTNLLTHLVDILGPPDPQSRAHVRDRSVLASADVYTPATGTGSSGLRLHSWARTSELRRITSDGQSAAEKEPEEDEGETRETTGQRFSYPIGLIPPSSLVHLAAAQEQDCLRYRFPRLCHRLERVCTRGSVGYLTQPTLSMTVFNGERRA